MIFGQNPNKKSFHGSMPSQIIHGKSWNHLIGRISPVRWASLPRHNLDPAKLKKGLVIQDEHSRHLVKYGGPLRRIHIEPIDRTPRKAVGYAMKAIEQRIPDPERLLILPKAPSELPDKKSRINSDIRQLSVEK